MASSILLTSLLPEGVRNASKPLTRFEKSLTERAASRSSDGVLTIPQAFGALLTALEPTAEQRTKASEQQQRVREKLDGKLALVNTYLSGSYRRRTLIQPVTDIDLLVVLDHEEYDLTTDSASAIKALDLVLAALDEAYPNTEKKRESRCIVMQFAGSGIGFDIVPVLQFEEHEFWMPDTSRGVWIRTNPREVERLVSEANQNTCDGYLVPLVKLAKAWKRHHKVPLRGFHLEAMIYHALKQAPANEREGIAFLFDRLQTNVRYSTYDVWPQGEQVDKYLSVADREKAAKQFGEAAVTARDALAAEKDGRTTDAHKLWHSLFGDRYPETGEQREVASLLSIKDAIHTIGNGRSYSATSAGIIPVTTGYATVRSATSHGGIMDMPEMCTLVEVSDEQRERLEAEIARARAQFTALERVDVAAAVRDETMWPVKPGDEERLYAVLVGEQGTNHGTRHRILVTIPKDMPATEPRVYLLQQHVERRPTTRHGEVRFVAKRSLKHQWPDGAMCSHAMRDQWDGRLVTMLVYAADWLLRQEQYRRTGRWIGFEIDGQRRLVHNGAVVGMPPKSTMKVSRSSKGAR